MRISWPRASHLLLPALICTPLVSCAAPDEPANAYVLKTCRENTREVRAASANAQTLGPPVSDQDKAIARDAGGMADALCDCVATRFDTNADIRVALDQADTARASAASLSLHRACAARIARPQLQTLCQSVSQGLGLVDAGTSPSAPASAKACACIATELDKLDDAALGAATWNLFLSDTQDSHFAAAMDKAAQACRLPAPSQ